MAFLFLLAHSTLPCVSFTRRHRHPGGGQENMEEKSGGSITLMKTVQRKEIILGRPLASPLEEMPPQIICDSPALQRHADQPWFRAFVARHVGLPVTRTVTSLPDEARVPDRALAAHTLIDGASNGGKTRLAELMASQHIRQGGSVLALEPKPQTIDRLCAQAQAAGLAPEQVTVLSPRMAALPGWNPFRTRLPPEQAVPDFVAVLERSTADLGPRSRDMVTNAAHMVAAHGLSLFELVELLHHENYLRGLIARPPARDGLGFQVALRFFKHEFLAWKQSSRTEATGPLMNKLRELLRNECLSAVLCAPKNTLDLPALWQRQGVVLVHIDRATLGEEGTRLLAGMMATSLLRTAQRASGPVPVALMLDEAATAEAFMGETLQETLSIAREYNLRVLACCQNISQLSEGLRNSLNTNTSVKVSFRLAPDDARHVARSLAAGTPARLLRVRAEEGPRDRLSGQSERALWQQRIFNAKGQPLRMNPALWERLRWQVLFETDQSNAAVDPVTVLMRQVGRLYVQAADTGMITELRQYVQGLRPREWWLDGPAPLTLVVSFARPRLTGADQLGEREAASIWARTLQSLPVQHAVLRVEGGPPVLLRVLDMPDAPLPARLKEYVAAMLRANALTREQTQATREARAANVDRVAESAFPALSAVRSGGTPRAPRPDAGQLGHPQPHNGSGAVVGAVRASVVRPRVLPAPAKSSVSVPSNPLGEEVGADGSLA